MAVGWCLSGGAWLACLIGKKIEEKNENDKWDVGSTSERNSDDLTDWCGQICEPRWRLRGIVWLIWWIKNVSWWPGLRLS